jgi:serine phosphatase RsbU (regulator of sigma subunit)
MFLRGQRVSARQRLQLKTLRSTPCVTESGDVLVLFTDGCRGRRRTSPAHAAERIRDVHGRPRICDAIRQDLLAMAVAQTDDISIVIVKRR